MTRTGERQVSRDDMGDDGKASLAKASRFRGSKVRAKFATTTFQSWTPWKSTPALKRSGRARQPEGGEVAAVRSAPQTDPRRIDIGPRPQVETRAVHVRVFGGPGGAVVQGLAEVEAVPDARAIVRSRAPRSRGSRGAGSSRRTGGSTPCNASRGASDDASRRECKRRAGRFSPALSPAGRKSWPRSSCRRSRES